MNLSTADRLASGREAPTVAGIVVAAGSGERLGADRPKGLVELAGVALVRRAVTMFLDAGLSAPIVVHPVGAGPDFAEALRGLGVAELVDGGATRAQSVRAGLSVVGAVDVVVIHDAARALAPAWVLIEAVNAVVAGAVAAAPGLPVADTLKTVDDRHIRATVDRHGLVGVQTPQVFDAAALRAALEALGSSGAIDGVTDELAVMELAREQGFIAGDIVVTPGSMFAHKLTTHDDLVVLTALAGQSEEARS